MVMIVMDVRFGSFISKKRIEKDISLRKMAELLDISPSYLSDIEKGRRKPPSLDKITQISKILNLSTADFHKALNLASEIKGEIPMDLSIYLQGNEVAIEALRIAFKLDSDGESDKVRKAWEGFIQSLL